MAREYPRHFFASRRMQKGFYSFSVWNHRPARPFAQIRWTV